MLFFSIGCGYFLLNKIGKFLRTLYEDKIVISHVYFNLKIYGCMAGILLSIRYCKTKSIWFKEKNHFLHQMQHYSMHQFGSNTTSRNIKTESSPTAQRPSNQTHGRGHHHPQVPHCQHCSIKNRACDNKRNEKRNPHFQPIRISVQGISSSQDNKLQ